jgi:phosphate starvation-inducible PhoH-like protein
LNELNLELTAISPREFFGHQNENINLLKKHFPKLKIVARGSKIKVFGDEPLLDEFDKRFHMLTAHFTKYNTLDENVIERVLTSSDKGEYESSDSSGDIIVHGVNGRYIKAITANQRKLVDSTEKNDMVFAIGPAGTGKTYTGVALAVKALKNKEVKRIILTRPAVEAGENLGFLPGDLKEKLDPYMQPLYDALRDMIPGEKLIHYIENGTIQIAPLAFMRGRTLDHAFVILDEAQNTTHAQMKMFLTRMGKSAKFLITGDPGQIDLPRRVISGLKEALLILKSVPGIQIIYLDDKDVIRHNLVKKVIDAYKNIEHQN